MVKIIQEVTLMCSFTKKYIKYDLKKEFWL